jgi:hypothetical protein
VVGDAGVGKKGLGVFGWRGGVGVMVRGEKGVGMCRGMSRGWMGGDKSSFLRLEWGGGVEL